MDPTLDQFHHDVFVTALEGGIGYAQRDAGALDANDADTIVQIGLFNTVIFS